MGIKKQHQRVIRYSKRWNYAGYFGYEAGQSCVGDHFAWFVENCVPESYEQEARVRGISIHQLLSEKLSSYKAGASGLLALDWFNGVRTPLMDLI